MPRKRYLITYDVADDKRRNSVFKALHDNGDHVQFSVFLCELSRQELASLRWRLTDAIHKQEDQVLIVDMGDARHPLESGIECVGQPYEPPSRVMVV